MKIQRLVRTFGPHGLTVRLAELHTTAVRQRDSRRPDDRGDVPGWVMITVMTALVVLALLAVFRDAVTATVTNAFDMINNAE